MKKVATVGILLLTLGLTLNYREELVDWYLKTCFDYDTTVKEVERNNYYIKRDYNYVKTTNKFFPNNKTDIMNLYYEIINSGVDEYTFYCPEEYKFCLNDVDYIANNQTTLSNINNYVNAFNSFDHIETEYTSIGKVHVKLSHTYDKEQISLINRKVDQILIDAKITTNMIDKEKIKAIHDYIINNTKYDSERTDNKVTTYNSDTAYGVLLQGYGICSGYADAMKLFLDRWNIPNYKISSENHIWNLVYVDNQWLHLDLTWDDPVSKNGQNILEYDYFLITSKELTNMETDQHFFDKSIYSEAN